MDRSRTIRVAAGAAALVALVASCGGGGGGSAGKAYKPGDPIAGSPGYDPATKTITLGVLTPTESIAKLIGDPITTGNKVFFDALNAKGGIDGKYKVKLLIQDNKYGTEDRAGTQVAYQATKNKVAAYLQILGSDPLHTILPNLAYDHILAGPATLESEWYESPNLMPIIAPYQVEAANGLDYYVNHMGGKGKKICTLTSDDGYGRSALAGVTYTGKQLGFSSASNQTFTSQLGTGTYDPQVEALQAAGCEAIWMAGLPTDTLGIFAAAMKINFAPQWLGAAPTWVGTVAAVAGQYAADHYMVVANGPEWGDSSVKGMRQLVADAKVYAPKVEPSFYFGYGYLQSQAMMQILSKAISLGDLSHKGIIDAMDKVGTIHFLDALPDLKYGSPAARQPQRVVSIFRVDPAMIGTTGGLVYYDPDKNSPGYSLDYGSDVGTKVPLGSLS